MKKNRSFYLPQLQRCILIMHMLRKLRRILRKFLYRSGGYYGKLQSEKKIESSTAISTFSAKEIQKQNPISAAALLQSSRFCVETSVVK
jgi:hypothetical protein